MRPIGSDGSCLFVGQVTYGRDRAAGSLRASPGIALIRLIDRSIAV